MAGQEGANDARHQRLEQIIAAYLQAVESGNPPDCEELIEQHPDLADDLRLLFREHDQIDVTGEGGEAGTPPTSETATLPPVGALSESPTPLSTRAGTHTPESPPSGDLDDATLPPDAPTDDASAAGAKVRYFGDYELLEEIARGGMGVVYRARQVSLNRIVALKMILAGQLASKKDIQRFHGEAEAAANLDHPGIVPIFEVGEHEGQHYFSMGYVEGQSLAETVAAGPLPADDAAETVNKVSEAVAYAHGQGVIHRDLKPANVLIDKNAQLRVTDFGLAKRLGGNGDLTATGQVLGTPSYMPPEQAAGKADRIKETADVYALGAILYTLLTGRPPFQAANPIDTLAQVLEQEPVSPRLLDPGLPKDLETICLKCLEKEPRRRYATASELSDDLRRYLHDEPIHARPISSVERLGRWARRQRRSVALTAAAAIVSAFFLASGLLVWYGYQQWRLGEVTFLTTSADSPHLVGEVLDEQGRSVSGLFTVPMQKPMELPSDSYRLRLSGSGRLSQELQFVVAREQQRQFELNLNDTQLWPTLQVERTYALADLEGQVDVILFNESGFSRLDGSSCRELWSVDVSASVDPAFRDASGFRWPWLSHVSRSGRGRFDRRPMLVQPAPDLDGDGIGDLVWAARHQAWLLAASGKDGKILWFAGRGQDTRQADDQAGQTRRQFTSTVVGAPSVVGDLDGDARADLLAMFADVLPAEERRGQREPQRWIEAISGVTGQSLWRFDLEARYFQLPSRVEPPLDFRWFTGLTGSEGSRSGGSGTMGHHWYRHGELSLRPSGRSVYVPDAPRAVRLGGKAAVVLVAGTYVIALDLSSGQTLWPAHKLSITPICPARYADLDGDAEAELIFVGPGQVPGQAPQWRQTPSSTRQLVAWSLVTRKPLWEKKIAASWRLYDFPECPPPEWPLATDLDGDGRDELIVPNGTSYGKVGAVRPWGALEVLDGATGHTRWQKQLITMDVQADRFTVGPDVDADGYRDVFVTTLCRLDNQDQLFVDALSGDDGRRLWWTNALVEVPNPYIGTVQFWDADARPRPQILVSVVSGYGRTGGRSLPDLFVFSSDGGQLTRFGLGMDDVQLGDGDGDGCSDIFSFRPERRENADHGGKLDALRGLSPETWRSLGRVETVVEDLNGDGDGDLLERPQLYGHRSEVTARSGRDGKVLWRKGVDTLASAGGTVAVNDLDGDRTADVLLYDATSGSGAGGTRWPLHAISGRTGRHLWSIDAPIGATAGSVLACSQDLDGDGRCEIIYIAANDWAYPTTRTSFSTGQAELWMAVLSARSGAILWKQPLGHSMGKGRTSNYKVDYGSLRVAFADLDEDGTLDILVPAEARATGDRLELRALDGASGKTLWKRALAPQLFPGCLLQDSALAVTGDVDGDAKCDVVVSEYFEKPDRDWSDRYHARVFVLDGADGKPKWPAWETKAEPGSRLFGSSSDPRLQNRPAPQLLARGKDKLSALVVTFWGSPGEAAVLEPDGRLITRFPLRGTKAYEGPRRDMWDGRLFVADLTDDGFDELIFASDGEIRAIRPDDDRLLWRWVAPSSPDHALAKRLLNAPDRMFDHQTPDFFDVRILGLLSADENHTQVVIVRFGNSVYGLSGTDGRQLWSSMAGRHRVGQRWFVPTMRLLPAVSGQMPRIVTEFANEVIVCQQGLVANQEVSVAVAPEAPGHANLPDDPRYKRPLPWSGGFGQANPAGVMCDVLWGIIFLVVLIVFPTVTSFRLARRRRWTLRSMFLLPLWLALVIMLLTADLPLISRQMRTIEGKLAWMAAVTPGVVLTGLLIVHTYQREWSRLLTWLLASLVIAIGLGGLLLIGEVLYRPLDVGEYYTWDGWYLLWLPGAYLAGVLAVAVIVGRRVMKPVWRAIASALARPKSA